MTQCANSLSLSLVRAVTIACLACLALWPTGARANDFYVATNGNDWIGTGAAAAPFATLLRAYNAAQPGDTILLYSGTYPTCLQILKAGLTITAVPGEQVTLQYPLNATTTSNLLWFLAPNCQVSNLTLDGAYKGQAYHCYYCVKAEGASAPGAVIANCTIKNACDALVKGAAPANADISTNPGMTLTVSNCNLYKDPGTPMLRSTWTAIDSLMNGTVVDHCSIHDMPGNPAISFKGGVTGCQATNNTITNMGNGIWLGAYDLGYVYNVAGSNPNRYSCLFPVCRGNTISTCRNGGIVLMGSCGAQVEGNVIVDAAKISQGAVYALQNSYGASNAGLTFTGNQVQVADGVPPPPGVVSYNWQRPVWYVPFGGRAGGWTLSGNAYAQQNGAVPLFWDFSVGSGTVIVKGVVQQSGWIDGSTAAVWAAWRVRYGEAGSADLGN